MRWTLNEGWTLSGAGFTLADLRLPLCVPQALARSGVIDARDTGLAPLRSEWIYRRAWTLSKTVSVQECTQERLFLSLPELTGRGNIQINGAHAADFDGACEIEVTQCLESGRCEIALVFEAGQEDRLFGVESGAQLRGVNCLWLTQARVFAGEQALRAFVNAQAYVPGRYVFRYAFEQSGDALGAIEFEENLHAGTARLEHLLEMEGELSQARRWREGAVNAPLHVRLLVTRRGEACDAALFATGLRRIDRAHSAPGLCACVCGIDGRRAALFGAVYESEPMAEMPGGKIVAQAREAGMTALYVKGCAKQAFYDACDVQGLMIFQELPADVPAAERMIAALGAHPCIVQWGCGAVRGAQGRMADLSHPTLSALAEMLNRWADERPFVGAAGGAEGALHAQGPEALLDPERMTRFFEQDTAPYRTITLPSLGTPEELHRASDGMECWGAQAGSGPLWTLRGGMWPPMDRLELRDFTGEDAWDDAEKVSLITRFLQAQTVRYALECARARDAAGLFAQRLGGERRLLCDAMLISPDGGERASYRAFAQAMKPVHVCARLDRTGFWTQTQLDAFVRVIADTPAQRPAQIEAALYRMDGTAVQRETFACALENGEYGCFHARLPEEPGALLLRLTLKTDEGIADQTDQLLCVGLTGPLWPLLHLPRTTLKAENGQWVNAGAFIACGVEASGAQWRCLLPGERVQAEPLRAPAGMNVIFVD